MADSGLWKNRIVLKRHYYGISIKAYSLHHMDFKSLFFKIVLFVCLFSLSFHSFLFLNTHLLFNFQFHRQLSLSTNSSLKWSEQVRFCFLRTVQYSLNKCCWNKFSNITFGTMIKIYSCYLF